MIVEEDMEEWWSFTSPEGIFRHKSLKIWMSGRVGYLKLTCCSSISPRVLGSVVPLSLPESILGWLSSIRNMEATESLTLLTSGAVALA